MTCPEADRVIPAYCDGELVGVYREQVERHLATCDACAGKSRFKSRFKAAVRAHLPPPPLPLGLLIGKDRKGRGDAQLSPAAPEGEEARVPVAA